MLEAVAGVAAIVLGVLGLVHVVPDVLAAVAVIVVGAALMSQGTSMASRFTAQYQQAGETRTVSTNFSGGLMLEFLGGLAGIILGILALITVKPPTLESIAVIAFGGVLLLSAGLVSRINMLQADGMMDEPARVLMRDSAATTSLIVVGTAVALIVLGILALMGVHTLPFILISMIVIGSAIVITGTAVSGAMLSMIRR